LNVNEGSPKETTSFNFFSVGGEFSNRNLNTKIELSALTRVQFKNYSLGKFNQPAD